MEEPDQSEVLGCIALGSAFAAWSAAVAFAIDTATYALPIGIVGLAVAVVAVLVLVGFGRSWTLAFAVAGVSSFVTLLFVYFSFVSVY